MPQPNVETIGTATVNFTCRIVGRVASAGLSYGATGRAGLRAEKLLGCGDMLFVAGGDGAGVRVPYCGHNKARPLPHKYKHISRSNSARTAINCLL